MRIDGISNPQATQEIKVPDILQKLNTGDILKARVMEAASDEVLLKLPDGNLLRASLATDIGVKAGDVLTLTMTGRSDGSIMLETVKTNGATAQNSTGEQLGKLLLSINEVPDKQNLELAGEFKQAGANPTKELFEAAKAIMAKFSSISPDKAVYITMKGIDYISGNMDSISQLLEGRLKLGEQLENLQNSINNILDKNGVQAQPGQVQTGQAQPGQAQSGQPQPGQVQPGAAQQLQQSAASQNVPELLQNPISQAPVPSQASVVPQAQQAPAGVQQQNAAPQQTASQQQSSIIQQSQGMQQIQQAPAMQEVQQPLRTQDGAQLQQQALQQQALQQDGESQQISSQQQVLPSQQQAQKASQPGAQVPQQTLVPQQSHAPQLTQPSQPLQQQPQAPLQQLQPQYMSQGFADDINNGIVQANTGDVLSELEKGSLELEKFRDTFNSLFIKTDSSDMDKLRSELDAKKLYHNIISKLEDIKSSLNTVQNLTDGSIAKQIDNMEDGFKLMNQINNNSVYLQLPVNISGYNSTAELYIFKRESKKKNIDPNNAVMLISLDTEHIGRIDSVVDVKGRNVSINFRAGKKDIADLIKENFKELYNSIQETGYRLVDMKCRLAGEAVTPVNAQRIAMDNIDSNAGSIDFRL
jgi:hypothetical protein